MNEYLLGQLVGASIPGAVVAFVATRKATKGVVPYLAALGGAVTGVMGMIGFNLLTHGFDTTDADVRKWEANLVKGCEGACTANGATGDQCRSLCACVLANARKRYPSTAQFADWIHEGVRHPERLKQEGAELSASCLPPAGTTP